MGERGGGFTEGDPMGDSQRREADVVRWEDEEE